MWKRRPKAGTVVVQCYLSNRRFCQLRESHFLCASVAEIQVSVLDPCVLAGGRDAPAAKDDERLSWLRWNRGPFADEGFWLRNQKQRFLAE